MIILISEKNGCAYTWNHQENILMYTPLLDNDIETYSFNILHFTDVTDIDDDELYELKEILK